MKKIINKPENIVMEMCNGMAMAYPELEFIQKYKIIKKKEINRNPVTISGGVTQRNKAQLSAAKSATGSAMISSSGIVP